MADEPENLILVYLRRMDQRLERVEQQNTEILGRMTMLELGMAGVRRDQGLDAGTTAGLQVAVDRLRHDVDRIARRLDLVEGPAH